MNTLLDQSYVNAGGTVKSNIPGIAAYGRKYETTLESSQIRHYSGVIVWQSLNVNPTATTCDYSIYIDVYGEFYNQGNIDID